MLHTDPTEAIHSELQVAVMERYFDILQYAPLGGAIAYQLLYQNRALYEEQHTREGRMALDRIIEADEHLRNTAPECNLFSFWIVRPRRVVGSGWGRWLPGSCAAAFPDRHRIASWQAEEDAREVVAESASGRYYPASALEIIYNEMADLDYQLSIRGAA